MMCLDGPSEIERYHTLRRRALHPLDILFWTCLMLGGAYTLVSLLMGGISHAAGHAGHIGDTLHIPHILGHTHTGHADVGHAGSAHGGQGAHAGHGHAHGHAGEEASGRHLDIHAHTEGGGFSVLQYLNPLSVAGFLLGFGGVGVASRILRAHPMASFLYGCAGGSGMWLVAYLIIARFFGAAGGTSHNLRE